ncbi:hypothetical protein H8K33_10165 [Undibacterium amnicola]|uniref:Uncharacterized protein n=2 Tax=Undibacterium amnicola TaxID=1834038 RepID=A0ABR6XQX7_9BURK|nr:hypothetical protein [Undibacterium amnicola]
MIDGMLNLTELEVTRAISAISAAKESLPSSDPRMEVFQLIIEGLVSIQNSTVNDFNKTYFLEVHATSFADSIKNINSTTEFSEDKIFWLIFHIYVVFKERSFREGLFSNFILRIESYFDSNISSLTSEQKIRMEFLRLNLPRHLLNQSAKTLVQEHSIMISDGIEKLEKINSKINEWEGKITQWKSRAENLENNLKESAEKLNFVGLAKAFSNLIDEKNEEKKLQIKWMTIFGIFLLLLPIFSKLTTSYLNVELKFELTALSYIMPFIIAELILLYFFRIFLHNFYSIKAQLLQLKLRHSLCAFIEGYAEFIEKSKKSGDAKLFEKFEAMIFSGISPDPQNVPSHFDGIEQISKIIKEFKGQ